MRENRKYGSVRSVDTVYMTEYCDTLHTEKEEKQGIQSMSKYIVIIRLLDKLTIDDYLLFC